VRAAGVRSYFDADILGLGKLIATLRADATYPGDRGGVVHKRARPSCPITTPHARDVDWIPVVAAAGWVAITRDRHIQDHRAELAAVRDHRLRLVALAAPEARTTWAQLEVLMCQWRAIEALVDDDGPLLRLATRTALRAVPLR
jgi:PIN like domain